VLTGIVKRAVLQAMVSLMYYTGLLRLYFYLRRQSSVGPDFTILMYHRVIEKDFDPDDPSQAGLVTLAASFERQMKYIAKHYEVVSLETLIERLRDGSRGKHPLLAVTFDDGWKDNYDIAMPILKKHDLPATVFLTTGSIETGRLLWFHTVGLILRDRLMDAKAMSDILARASLPAVTGRELIEALKKLPPTDREPVIDAMVESSGIDPDAIDGRRWMLGWGEVRRMAEAGISFGSHGISHTVLTEFGPEEIRREVTASKDLMEKQIGKAVTTFAYPNGDFDTTVRELVAQAGYQGACATGRSATVKGRPDLMALPRKGVHEGMTAGITGRYSPAIFACRVAGLFTRRERAKE
jgi:peptidoglycan/xylan/chitin deacetylase (PgdA/CDA1 family)